MVLSGPTAFPASPADQIVGSLGLLSLDIRHPLSNTQKLCSSSSSAHNVSARLPFQQNGQPTQQALQTKVKHLCGIPTLNIPSQHHLTSDAKKSFVDLLWLRLAPSDFDELLRQADTEVDDILRSLTGNIHLVPQMLAFRCCRLSSVLSDLGMFQEALDISQKSVQILRSLPSASAESRIGRGNIAIALKTLSRCYYDLSRHNESLDTIEESVDIFRTVNLNHPGMLFGLTEAICYLGASLAALGMLSEAIDTLEEAKTLCEPLADKWDPSTYGPLLVLTLNTYAVCFRGLGLHRDALQACVTVVERYRKQLHDEGPSDHLVYEYAQVLADAPLYFLAAEEEAAALNASDEALKIYTSSMQTRQKVYITGTARAFYVQYICLKARGREGDARKALLTSAEACTQVQSDCREVYKPWFRGFLDSLRNALVEEKLLNEAEHIDILRHFLTKSVD